MKKIISLFPYGLGNDSSSNLFCKGIKELKKIATDDKFKLSFRNNKNNKEYEFNKLTKIPENGKAPEEVVVGTINSFFNKIPLWRSAKNQYNICAPTNVVSVALSSLAQEYNIHNINNDFSGDCLLTEKIISNMAADLVGINKQRVTALFSFGGTASNLYAMKIALNNTFPNIGKTGMPSNAYMLITQDSHFSHKTAADWLGIGTNNLIVVNSDEEGRSLIEDAEEKIEDVIQKIFHYFLKNLEEYVILII